MFHYKLTVNVVIILLILLCTACASKPNTNIVNIKMDGLSKELIVSDITNLLKVIHAPAKTNLVINTKSDKIFIELLQNRLRSIGYSVREIRHNEAIIYNNELLLEYIIDRINDSADEKRLKRINNDSTTTIRVSVIISGKIYSRLYLLTKSLELTPLSRWLESDYVSSAPEEDE